MPEFGRADRAQLLQWADRISARSELPRLIRKLILETGKGVVQLGFPAGEGVGAGDWDGSVRATEATPFVPDGLSVWELSVNKSPASKADSDYAKRMTTPDGSATRDCTYVAVSLRPWEKRAEWARKKQRENRWRAIRAYGVDDIEMWLEEAPVTHAWLSEEMGLAPWGLRASESWWKQWSKATTPPMSSGLVLAGRDQLIQTLGEHLSSPPTMATVKGASVEEVKAVLSALAIRAAQEGKPQILARLAFVDDVATWRALQEHRQPLILVPSSGEIIKELAGASSNHHVLVPLVDSSNFDYEVPPLGPEEAMVALQAAGLDNDQRAEALGRLGRRSLLALRRNLAVKPELHTPAWARPPGSRVIRAALIAGRWNMGLVGDRKTLEGMTGKKDEDLRDALDELLSEEDPLIGRYENSWALVSSFDAWLQLGSQVRDSDLKRLETAVKEVLLEPDPALAFPPEERWRATFDEKVSSYSGSLKRGLAESIALLGVNGVKVADGRGEEFATYLVRTALGKANDDESGQLWSTLSRQLPLLAEAAPDAFLDAVRSGLQGNTPVLARLFGDSKDQSALFSAGSPHVSMLWALETLAWSPEHFGQVVHLLAQYAEIDPGGSMSNRPAESLQRIFCPWHPENAVDNASRLDAIDALRERHPQIAWTLMLSMLPEKHGFHLPTSEPTFREWKPPRQAISNLEYFELVNGITERLVDDAGVSGSRWATLLERGSDLLADGRVLIRKALEARAAEVPEEERPELWKAIRAFVAKHREYSETDWALPTEELDQLETIQSGLEPPSTLESRRWLFEEHAPDIGTAKLDDFERYEDEVGRRRAEAVLGIEKEAGLGGLLGLAADSPVPWTVGAALAANSDDCHEGELLDLLTAEDESKRAVAVAYFSHRFRQRGWKWLEHLLDTHESLPPTAVARLLLNTSDYPLAWEKAGARGENIEAAFWAEFSPYGLGADFKHMPLAVERLLQAQRPATALRLLELYLRKDLPEPDRVASLLADTLDALLKADVSGQEIGPEGLAQHSFESFFNFLEKHRDAIGTDRLARLEWAYLAALGYDPSVPTLHGALSSDPEFFVQVVSAIYKPRSTESESEPSADERRAAENGYRLLSSWSVIPGAEAGGRIDENALRQWVDEARRLLEEADRLEVGETHIGHVLAHAPRDSEDRWPAEPVRNLLELLQSETVEQGMRIQTYNNRGVTSRALDAGGEQERELAEMYQGWEKALRNRWPRTAAVLRDLAISYRRDAQRHDAEAEQRRRGLDI